MRGVLAPSLQQCNQRIGQRNRSGFVRLRSEVDVFFAPDVICPLVEVYVAPRSKRDFLIAATGSEEEFVADPLFVIHRSEEHTSELQSHSFISYAVFCLKKT